MRNPMNFVLGGRVPTIDSLRQHDWTLWRNLCWIDDKWAAQMLAKHLNLPGALREHPEWRPDFLKNSTNHLYRDSVATLQWFLTAFDVTATEAARHEILVEVIQNPINMRFVLEKFGVPDVSLERQLQFLLIMGNRNQEENMLLLLPRLFLPRVCTSLSCTDLMACISNMNLTKVYEYIKQHHDIPREAVLRGFQKACRYGRLDIAKQFASDYAITAPEAASNGDYALKWATHFEHKVMAKWLTEKYH